MPHSDRSIELPVVAKCYLNYIQQQTGTSVTIPNRPVLCSQFQCIAPYPTASYTCLACGSPITTPTYNAHKLPKRNSEHSATYMSPIRPIRQSARTTHGFVHVYWGFWFFMLLFFFCWCTWRKGGKGINTVAIACLDDFRSIFLPIVIIS